MTTWRDIEGDSTEKYELYLCSREWAERKKHVIDRCFGICERCHIAGVQSVHHLTYIRKYNEPLSDLQGLCDACHQYIHGQTEFDPAAVSQFSDLLQDSMERCDRREEHGVSTGVNDIDALIGNMRAGSLSILASRPGMGKSAFCYNIALNAARETGVLLVSLEATYSEVTDKMLQVASGVSSRRMRNGLISADDRRRLIDAADEIYGLPLWIERQSSMTASDICEVSTRCVQRHDVGLVIVDFLNMIVPPNDCVFGQEHQVFENVRSLKILARDLAIPVLATAQLNRDVDSRDDKVPKLSDLRGSGTVAEIADHVICLHRPYYYDKTKDPAKLDALIVKNRFGPEGWVTLAFDPESGKVSEGLIEEEANSLQADGF